MLLEIEGESNPASVEPFSIVIKIADKELTIAPKVLDYITLTVLVKNSGHATISLAEIETIYWDQQSDKEVSEQIQVEDLAPGDVQTIVWHTAHPSFKGSYRIEVTNIE